MPFRREDIAGDKDAMRGRGRLRAGQQGLLTYVATIIFYVKIFSSGSREKHSHANPCKR